MGNVFAVFNMLPAIIAAMKAIEEALPAEGQGAQKLAAVQGLLQAVDSTAVALAPQIGNVIGVMATLFNNSGVFKKAGS